MAQKEQPAIERVRKAIEDAEAARTAARRESRAYELGFDDLDLYDLWSSLEQLRKVSLSARTDVEDKPQRVSLSASIGRPTFPLAG